MPAWRNDWLEGVPGAGKTHLLGIATRHEQKINHKLKRAKIFPCEKEAAVISSKLRAWLGAVAPMRRKGETIAKIC